MEVLEALDAAEKTPNDSEAFTDGEFATTHSTRRADTAWLFDARPSLPVSMIVLMQESALSNDPARVRKTAASQSFQADMVR